MDTPPPLPPESTLKRPVKRAVFQEGVAVRLGDVHLDWGMIQKSHSKAEQWLNEHPGIEIINIETFHCSTDVFTVVWYR